jgi:hypothetical protein
MSAAKTLEQQAEFVRELPEVFLPVHGGWGADGDDPHSARKSERGRSGWRSADGMEAEKVKSCSMYHALR